MYTVEDVAKFLKLNRRQGIKTLFFLADGEPVMALVRGDHELNETSSAGSWAYPLEKAPAYLRSHAGCRGFAGPWR